MIFGELLTGKNLPSTEYVINNKLQPNKINKSVVCIFWHTFWRRWYLSYLNQLNDVTFVRSDIYQLKSAKHQNVFPYSKTGAAPAWLDIKKYLLFSQFKRRNSCGWKYWEQRMHTESPKTNNMRNRRNASMQTTSEIAE